MFLFGTFSISFAFLPRRTRSSHSCRASRSEHNTTMYAASGAVRSFERRGLLWQHACAHVLLAGL